MVVLGAGCAFVVAPRAIKLMLLHQSQFLENLQVAIYRGQADAGRFPPSLPVDLVSVNMSVRLLDYVQNQLALLGAAPGEFFIHGSCRSHLLRWLL